MKNKPLSLLSKPLVQDSELLWLELSKQYDIEPSLHVIIVGDNTASKLYVKNKQIAAKRLGIKFTCHSFENISQKDLIATINTLNHDESCHGIIVQSPLPKQLSYNDIVINIDPKKDVDGFHPLNRGLHQLGRPCFVPCTALGVKRLLDYYGIVQRAKKIAILGRSAIVGLPTTLELLCSHASVSVFHSKAPLDKNLLSLYDIIIFATGTNMSHLVDSFSPHQTLVDVGINSTQGKVHGDLGPSVQDILCQAHTPVPGGVGPMTVNSLMYNTIIAAAQQFGLKKFEKEFITTTASLKRSLSL